MTRTFLVAVVLLVQSNAIFACCAERDYRLIPIGEWEGKVVFVEMDLFRNCEMRTGSERNDDFWAKGLVSLVQNSGDTLELIEVVDTVDITECKCDYRTYFERTEFESKLMLSYKKALNAARGREGFLISKPQSISFNDTLHTEVIEEYSDTSSILMVNYRDSISIDLSAEEIISCSPNKLAEVRTYETENFIVTVLRVRCYFHSDEAVKHAQERFKGIETGIWKEAAQWHGIAKDFWIVESNRG